MRTARLATIALVAFVSAAAGYVAARAAAPREARAEERPTTTTIYVGGQGLYFRTLDGKAIARLSSDANGGVLEVLDATGNARTRVRASGLDVVTGPPVPAPPPVAAPISSAAPPAAATASTPPPSPRTHAVQSRVDLGF